MKLTSFLRFSALMVGLSLNAGCGVIIKDPIYHSVTRSTKKEKLNNELRSYQVSWLAQALLKPETRGAVARNLVENAPDIAAAGGFSLADAADVSIAAQMVTDLAVGQLGSGLGGSVGNTLFLGGVALSMLAGDGSLKVTSVVLLPEELNGEVLDSAELAKAAAQQLIVERYATAATKFGYSFTCEYACTAFPSAYRMQRQLEADTSAFLYAADDVAFYFADFEVIAPEQTQAVDSLAAGFNVAWRSHFNNDARIDMLQNPLIDEQGNIEIEMNDKKIAGWTFYGDKRFFQTDFGRDFLREVYKTPYMLYGTANDYPRVAYYDGEVYQYILNGIPDAFDRVVLPFQPLEQKNRQEKTF